MKTWAVCAITACIIAVGCSYGGRPAISLGTGIDEKTSGVTGFTDRFLLKDTIAYSLTQNRPFGFSGITLRFYKGKNIFEMERIVNEDISLVPEAKSLTRSIPVWKLAGKYGAGDYMILFMKNDVVIAKKMFVIEVPRQIVAAPIPADSIDNAESAVTSDTLIPEKEQSLE